MGIVMLALAVIIVASVFCTLPLYLCINFVLWLFHAPYSITLLQAWGVGILITTIANMISKNKGGDK